MSLSCPNCGSSSDPSDVYCGICGHPVPVHSAQTAESVSVSAYGQAQWPEWGTGRERQASPADEASQRTHPQRPVPGHRQVSPDVPEGREVHGGGWDAWRAHAKTGPRPQPAPSGPASGAPRSARASIHPADGAAAVASGDVRVAVANPRDQAESGIAAADPQSYITADDRRMGYAALGVSGTLDPLSNSRFFWQMARRFALYTVVSTVIGAALFVLAFMAAVLDGNLAGLLTGSAFKAVAIINSLIGVALMALFVFLPIPALLGQWSRMLTFQAPVAGSALSRVRQALNHHAIPHDKLGMRTLSPPGEGRRDYLELRRGYFAGYVSCFPHGHDLYVGWTFWIYISPFQLFLARVGRRIQNYTGRGNDMYQTLRYEPARATIAALHACTLEGVDIATGGTTPSDGSE
jgi:hypothetical protein